MVLCILEGPDCAGKTTLAGRLVDRLRRAEPDASVGYRHAGPPEHHPLDEYVEPLLTHRPGEDHLVCDRWHVGESVYPALLGRPSRLTPAVRAYVEKFLQARGALLVYCATGHQHLYDCGVARGDAAAERGRLQAALDGFNEAVVASQLPKMIVDVADPDDPDYDRVIGRVLGVAAEVDAAARPLAPFVTYVGPPRPSLLLVGDRRGTPAHDLDEFDDWPAFVPRPSTSGAWLLDALTRVPLTVPTHGVQLRDVALVNANDVDDVRAVWDAVGRPRVVALGRHADARLTELDVPHGMLPHPQYYRRFFHHMQTEYLYLVVDVAAAVLA